MLKRPFVCVAIVFAAGILSFAYEINIFLLLTVSLLLTVLVYIRGEKHRYLLFTLIAVFLLGILGMKTADYNKEKVVRRFEGREITTNMTVAEFSSDGRVIASFRENGRNYKIYLAIEEKGELVPGDIIKVVVKPQRPYTSKVSISDFSTHLASRKVYLYGYASDVKITGRQKSGIMGMVYSIRRYVDKIGKNNFSGDIRALFNAMILGDKRLMTPEVSASLRASGINHIAVVSGMHLSVIITALMFLLGSIIGKGRNTKILLSAGAVFVTLITGAGLSAIRACVMCIVCQGAFLTSRENDALSGLSVAVFVMLVFNPFTIFDIGFILSVLSVLGILLFTKPVNEIVSKRIKGKIGEILSVSIAVQLTITPVLIMFFGTVAPYGVFANLLVTAFASLAVIAGMAFTVVAKIPLVSKIAVFIVKLCCETILRMCNLIKKFPGAVTDADGLGYDFFIIWAFMLVIFGLEKKKLKFVPIISLCFLFVLTGLFVKYSYDKKNIKMDFVSYGNRVMTVADCPKGPFVLIGCPDYSDAVSLSEAYGRQSYTYTVITNKKDLPDVTELVSRGETERVIVCSEMLSPNEKKELEKSCKEVVFLESGKLFSDKDFSIKFRTFRISDEFVTATDIEYKGKTFVSLQDFDGFGVEELCRRKCFFQCDYLLTPKNLPPNTGDYDKLTSGKVINNEKNFAINLY